MPEGKPLPLVVDGRPHYTLGSYAAPEMELVVPRVTDWDLLMAVAGCIEPMGGRLDTLDDAWFHAHGSDLHVPDDMPLRAWLEGFRRAIPESQKAAARASLPARCACAVADRLCQRVPDEDIASAQAALLEGLEAEEQADPAAFRQRLALLGLRDAHELAALQAPQIAAQYAALDAWADHEGIEVRDDELAPLLRLDPKMAEELLQRAREQGFIDALRAEARRNKAALRLADASPCTFSEESPESAERRRESYRAFEQASGIDLARERARLLGTDA